MNVGFLAGVLVVLGLAAQDTLAAQGKPPKAEALANGLELIYVPSDEAPQVSLALAVPVGWVHDPEGRTGYAQVMRWLFALSQRSAAPGAKITVNVQPRLTLFSHTGPTRGAVDRLAFLEKVLAGKISVTGDDHALAVGRARLQADNHSWLYPGSVIQQRAWRDGFRGEPAGRQGFGIGREIGAISAEEMRQRLGRYGCRGAALVVLGGLPAAPWRAVRQRLVALPESKVTTTTTPTEKATDTAPPLVHDAGHDRVDGPYVTAAVRAVTPGDADYLPFVIGMLVLRSQAYREFRSPRGMEWQARFPYLAYDFWADDLLVRINRRGTDWTKPDLATREIADLLGRIRNRGVSRAQFDAAVLQARSTLAVPPFANQSGPFLAVRARYFATALCRDWPLDLAAGVLQVTREDVHRVLREHLAPDRLRWFVLRPTKKPPLAPSAWGFTK